MLNVTHFIDIDTDTDTETVIDIGNDIDVTSKDR